jgi:predicted transcriptional regulator
MKKIAASKRKVKVSVALTPVLAKRIDRMAKVMSKSRSQMVQELIEGGMDDSEISAAAMTNPAISQALLTALGKPEVIRAMLQVMRQDLSEDQLDLFGQAMAGMREFVSEANR